MQHRLRRNRVLLFVLLTFSLTWGFDWLMNRLPAVGAYPDLGMTPLGMFFPAFVALVLRMFVFRDSRLHIKRYKEKPRWVLLAFLVMTPVYGSITVLAVILPESRSVMPGISALLLTLWLLWVFFILGRSSEDSIARAGLGLGDVHRGRLFVVAVVVFLLLQSVLNLATGLGELQGKADHVYGLPVPESWYVAVLSTMFIPVTVIGIPLSGLAATFGEEYGWRGFLQDELVKVGTIPGVVLVGFIWGLWHFPVILRGIHTYPPTWQGLSLGTVFFVLWGVLQSYAVLKTASIWPAAFMHGVVNSVYGFTLKHFVYPDDKLISFGLGIFGMMFLAVIVALVLLDPIWRSKLKE